VLIVVGVLISLYLLYMLRKPLTWLAVAAFLAVALAGPVNWLNRRMRRGLAIAAVYLGMLAIPFLLMALIVPPLITEANNFAENLPQYSQDVTDFVQGNDRLRRLNEDYDITSKLQEEAEKLPERLGGAAKTLSSVGVGLVNSIFALLTILILTAFMLGSGHRWRDAILSSRPADQRERLRRSLDHIGAAVGGYVAGAFTVAAIVAPTSGTSEANAAITASGAANGTPRIVSTMYVKKPAIAATVKAPAMYPPTAAPMWSSERRSRSR